MNINAVRLIQKRLLYSLCALENFHFYVYIFYVYSCHLIFLVLASSTEHIEKNMYKI